MAVKKVRLGVYRLAMPIPEKHKHRPEGYRQMLQIDLDKTLKRMGAQA